MYAEESHIMCYDFCSNCATSNRVEIVKREAVKDLGVVLRQTSGAAPSRRQD